MSYPDDGLNGSMITVPLNRPGSIGRFTSIRVVYGRFRQPSGPALAGHGAITRTPVALYSYSFARPETKYSFSSYPEGTGGSGPNPSAINGKSDGVEGIGPATVGVGTARRLTRAVPPEAHPVTPKHAHDTTRHPRSRRRAASGIAHTDAILSHESADTSLSRGDMQIMVGGPAPPLPTPPFPTLARRRTY